MRMYIHNIHDEYQFDHIAQQDITEKPVGSVWNNIANTILVMETKHRETNYTITVWSPETNFFLSVPIQIPQ